MNSQNTFTRYSAQTVMRRLMLASVPIATAFGLVSLPAQAMENSANSCTDAATAFVHADEEVKASHALATIEDDAGTCIRFTELEPGEVAVIGVGPQGTLPPSMRFSNIDSMSLTQLYEALAGGETAPAALLAAEVRIAQAPDLIAHPSDTPAQKTQGAVADTVGRGAFATSYCNYGYDFTYCYENRTGSASITKKSKLGEQYVNPYRGSVHLQLEYKKTWGWKDTAHFTVNEGYVGWALGFGSRKKRRAGVHYASGDGYHWVFQGAE